MSATVHVDDLFEKARVRAREEQLRQAIDREVVAHRALCDHYNKAIERIAELEDSENKKMAELEQKLSARGVDLARLSRRMKTLKARQMKANIIFACLGFIFIAFVAHQTKLTGLLLNFSE